MDERLKIIDNIINITDENKNIIDFKDLILEYSCNKYSAKKNNIYHIILNGRHLSKSTKYYFKYKCVTCNSIHIISTVQFLRKINKCSYRCNLCCNKDDVIKSTHSTYMTTKWVNKECKIVQEPKSLIDIKNHSIKLFDEYDDEFKENYFKYHLTDDDYLRISKNIISFQNGKKNIEKLEYWPIYKTNNQMIFTSFFYDKENEMLIKANQPIMKCDNCYKQWRAKLLEKYKNCHKILCNDCILCNKTFKIRQTKNNINEHILYQSNLELKFIKWCNNHNIIIKNGPIIPYLFEGKLRKYKVDFQIKNYLIEIKDNHIWQDDGLKSGKWQAKEKAVYNEISQNKYEKYFLITPKNWINSLNELYVYAK